MIKEVGSSSSRNALNRSSSRRGETVDSPTTGLSAEPSPPPNPIERIAKSQSRGQSCARPPAREPGAEKGASPGLTGESNISLVLLPISPKDVGGWKKLDKGVRPR